MAKKQKQEEAPAGSPAWMATFSDLMNLLLCFFVLLFSMSSTDTAKFEEVIASIQSSFSIFSSGGSSIGEGHMISSGISQLEMFDDYFKSVTDGEDEDFEHQGASDQQTEGEQSDDGTLTENGANTENGSQTEEGQSPGDTSQQNVGNKDISVAEAKEALKEAGNLESEQIAEEIEEQLKLHGLQDQVEVDFNAEYVMITINGALLFESGKAYLAKDAVAIIDNLAAILSDYDQNIIEIEGHTDNVPMHSGTYENNDVLSMYRALYVADRIREKTNLNPAHIKSAGRGEYLPIADNSTAEGRARNRRVEIKIFNKYSSDFGSDAVVDE
ncbi:OmpA/MotB family protein [Pseudobutyrivibrio xylanivorans]|uniref:Chemotaxis protein MotB n=1 Tax=Pseudobutyrivibrio xylanivorans TaxID=185007 RepID=A0A1G5RWI3_PSEXY|nr:flagellar motor protein MotB [Pseudobutyrivibrio xylanivorans]SCZ78472.1 chemotaxis protein MotB [Pseudobutyrivibrio xylanivorans]